jgi:hypothetical protein
LLFWIIFLGGWGQLGLSFTSIAHETSHTIIPPEAVTPIDHPTNPPIVSAFLVPHALYQIVISACSQGSFWLNMSLTSKFTPLGIKFELWLYFVNWF